MRNSTGATTSSSKKSDKNASSRQSEMNSAKKLVQARLPFKVIAPGSSPITAVVDSAEERSAKAESAKSDIRKRKLSYESESEDIKDTEADNVSKENVGVKATNKKKKLIAANVEVEAVVSLLDDEEDEDIATEKDVKEKSNVALTAPSQRRSLQKNSKTPANKDKRKGAGTPKTPASTSAHKEKNNSASKLTIKLPISAGKKHKRRKSKILAHLSNTSANDVSLENNSCAESSDDIEDTANKLNPQKRKKLENETAAEEQQDNDNSTKQEEVSIVLDSDSDNDEATKSKAEANTSNVSEPPSSEPSPDDEIAHDDIASVSIANGAELNESVLQIPSESEDNDGDDDADDETENTMVEQSDSTLNVGKPNTSGAVQDLNNSKSAKQKTLTLKQKKLMERRQMAREEKERKLMEERKKKQQDKEEKEQAKKREREEKEDQKRKEREEKEEQRRKEREEKERKRLAEIEVKNEEKRKRNEAKEEELRKKEEDRKRKEQEKEEAELKKKKAADAFSKFFVAKSAANPQQTAEVDENSVDGSKVLAFRPFQIKGDMKLAPTCRRILTNEGRLRLESLMGCCNNDNAKAKTSDTQLYLNQLKSGDIMPGKWRRPSTESKDDDVLIIDELERVGQAIVEDTPAYVREEMRVKFYKFHDNRRPPYYGTFRKKSTTVTGRRPFAQDKKYFDYEVDSDDEWEEEEPGESLEDGSDDDKEKESEDEDYEVDNEWFVPHGHLSDEELQNEEEFGDADNNTREAQKAKLQILQQEFAQEMKKKTEKIKPRLIGCIWVDENGKQPAECPRIIWDTLGLKSMILTNPPLVEEPKVEESGSPSANGANADKAGADKPKPLAIDDRMLKDLVRLVHGNMHSKNFLVKEYMAYVEQNEDSIKNGEYSNPLKSTVREKIDGIAKWQALSTVNHNRKKKTKKRLCWVVDQQVLDTLSMSALDVDENKWKYILKSKLMMKLEEAANAPLDGKANLDDAPSNELIVKKTTIKNNSNSNTSLSSPIQSTQKASKEKTSQMQADCSPKEPVKQKKRVPLLMSVARGQQIPTPAKNKLISQFLQKNNNNKASRTSDCDGMAVDDDDIVVLD